MRKQALNNFTGKREIYLVNDAKLFSVALVLPFLAVSWFPFGSIEFNWAQLGSFGLN